MKQCKKCGGTAFYSSGDCKQCSRTRCRKYNAEHTEAIAEQHRRYRAEHKDTLAEQRQGYYAAHKQAISRYNKQYQVAHKDTLAEKRRQYNAQHKDDKQRYRADHKEAIAEKNKQLRSKHKTQVFGHYGHKCMLCGSTNDLQIDHINGGGGKHRKEIGQGRLYAWLINNHFPPGFQTLCKTCNFAKHSMTTDAFLAHIERIKNHEIKDRLVCIRQTDLLMLSLGWR